MAEIDLETAPEGGSEPMGEMQTQEVYQNGGVQDNAVEGSKAADPAGAGPKGSSGNGKIFIGGLTWDTTTEMLKGHFGKYGELTDAVIMKDRNTGQPRGFGFVTFADAEICDKVVLDKHVIDGRTVEAKKSVPQDRMVSKGPKTKKIFVGGLPPSITEEEFKTYFGQYGTVVEQQIMQDHSTGRSRGFGFVTFESEQVVEDVIAQGKMHEINGKQVEIKKAEPKRNIDGPPGGGLGGGGRGYSGGRGGYGGGGYGDQYGGYGGGGYGGGGYGRTGGGGRGAGGYGGAAGGYGGSYGAGGGYGGGYGAAAGGYGAAAGGYGAVGAGAGYGSGSYGGASTYGGSSYGTGLASGSYGGYGAAAAADDYSTGYAGYGAATGAGASYGGGGYGSYGARTGGYGSGGAAAGGAAGNGRYHPYGR